MAFKQLQVDIPITILPAALSGVKDAITPQLNDLLLRYFPLHKSQVVSPLTSRVFTFFAGITKS